MPGLTDFIIGAVADAEPYMTPPRQGRMADSLYWRNISYAERCRRRQELLTVTPAGLTAFAEPLEKLMETASICVIGGQRQLDACREELDEVFSL